MLHYRRISTSGFLNRSHLVGNIKMHEMQGVIAWAFERFRDV